LSAINKHSYVLPNQQRCAEESFDLFYLQDHNSTEPLQSFYPDPNPKAWMETKPDKTLQFCTGWVR
jgi:hypothetical protein